MTSIAKNDCFTVTIDGLNSQGQGVCRIDGRAVFVPLALPGELWEIKVLKVNSAAIYAKGLKLIEAAKSRIEPICPVFSRCGGCSTMHMSYEQELEFKLSTVNSALRRIGGTDFEITEIIGADDRYHYRNKAIYAVGDAVTGFFRSRSHDIIPVEECFIQSPIADKVAATLRDWMQKNDVSAYDESSGKGSVRHVFTRTTRDNSAAVACIVSARGFGGGTQSLVAALRDACPELSGIVLNVNKAVGNTVLSEDFHTLWGSDILTDALCGYRFEFSPLSFFQINPPQAERLYNRAVEYAQAEGATVLDLYCGAGTISLCMAKQAKKVIGVEIVAAAIENAKKNADLNGVENAEFFCADAGKAAEELLARGTVLDILVVDPPRKGLAPEVIESIDKMKPKRVVYVSCDPATLARDVKIFAEYGFKIEKGTAVDMFPCTRHVECVVLMSKVQK